MADAQVAQATDQAPDRAADRATDPAIPAFPVVPDAPDASIAPDAPVEIVVLTDEEVAALAEPHPLVVQPYLVTLAESAADCARWTALRSLLSRGLIAALPDPGRNAVVGLRPDIATVLDVRESAHTVLAIRRTTMPAESSGPTPSGPGTAAGTAARGTTAGASVVFRYLHLLEDIVLIEDVDAMGLHRFALLAVAGVAREMQAFLVSPAAVDGSGHWSDADALERIAGCDVVADLVSRRPQDGGGVLRQLYAGPLGCFRDAPGCGVELVLEPLPADEVGAWVAAMLVADCAAWAPGPDACGGAC